MANPNLLGGDTAALKSRFAVLTAFVGLLMGTTYGRAVGGPAQEPPVEFVPGEILVKFKPGIDVATGQMRARQPLPLTSHASANVLFARHAVSDAIPVFPGAKPPIAGRTVTVEGKTIPVPDLTRVYKLVLGAGADVQAAVTDFANDPNVDYAEPTYIARRVCHYDHVRNGERLHAIRE